MKTKTGMKAWMVPWIFLVFAGCATIDDVQILDKDIHRIDSQMNTLQKNNEALRSEVAALKPSQKEFQREMAAVKSESQAEIKKLRADHDLRLDALQSENRVLSTGIEEYKEFLNRPSRELDRVKEDVAMRLRMVEERVKTYEGREKAREDRARALEEGTRGVEGKLEARMKAIEDSLKSLEAKLDRMASKQGEMEKAAAPRETKEAKEPKETVEPKGLSAGASDLYKDAYETFQRGNLDAARRKFEAFLKQYPNTELSDNAQFWIGETHYLQKDYEKAILEYEKAVAKYPEGDKISAALFKQGLAFLELGDKSTARNLLRRVVDRYPHSDQAEMARKRLETIK
jgi:tol-pal system protein YbgF